MTTFNEKFRAILSAPTGKLKDKKGRSVRMIQFKMKSDFTDAIGGGLDKHGKAALQGLRTRGLSQAKIPIDAVAAKLKLRCQNDRVTFNAVGVELIGKANMNQEDTAPIAEIVWRFDYTDKAWAFLGKHFGTEAAIEIQSRQLELDDIDAANEEEEDAKAN